MLAVCERSTRPPATATSSTAGTDGVPRTPRPPAARSGFPGLTVAGTYSPPFRDADRARNATAIVQAHQRRQARHRLGRAEHAEAGALDGGARRPLTASVLIGVGAAFDFHAGLKRQAPRWMQQSGLEWLFRLMNEPRRLGRRYLVNNPQFVWLMLLQMWRGSETETPAREPAAAPTTVVGTQPEREVG